MSKLNDSRKNLILESIQERILTKLQGPEHEGENMTFVCNSIDQDLYEAFLIHTKGDLFNERVYRFEWSLSEWSPWDLYGLAQYIMVLKDDMFGLNTYIEEDLILKHTKENSITVPFNQ